MSENTFHHYQVALKRQQLKNASMGSMGYLPYRAETSPRCFRRSVCEPILPILTAATTSLCNKSFGGYFYIVRAYQLGGNTEKTSRPARAVLFARDSGYDRGNANSSHEHGPPAWRSRPGHWPPSLLADSVDELAAAVETWLPVTESRGAAAPSEAVAIIGKTSEICFIGRESSRCGRA